MEIYIKKKTECTINKKEEYGEDNKAHTY